MGHRNRHFQIARSHKIKDRIELGREVETASFVRRLFEIQLFRYLRVAVGYDQFRRFLFDVNVDNGLILINIRLVV